MMIARWSDILQKCWATLAGRHPRLRWLQKWGISATSLVSGAGTIFIFRHGIEYFPWFLGYLLLLWLVGVVFVHVRRDLEAQGRRVVTRVVDYTVQTLIHGLLLFLIPIYYASTTLASRNVWFLALLVAGAILSAIDPWYRAAILRFRWIEMLLFGFGLFASLNVAFPLVRVGSTWALLLSGIASVLALAPGFRRTPERLWRPTMIRAGAGAAVAAVLLWLVRAWIPPVPMHLTRSTFARAVVRLTPRDAVSEVSARALREWGGLACFTVIQAPAGLREPISHVWRRNGTTLTRIALSPISGGIPGGFRTFSRKTDLGPDPTGTWWVDVLTAHDQLIGRVRLVVTP